MNPTLRQGSRGLEVRQLQQQLGITSDGIFGPQTAAAVRQFQRDRGLSQDAIVGPKTWAALTAARAQNTTPTGESNTLPVDLSSYSRTAPGLSSQQIRQVEERRRLVDKQYQEALAKAARGVPYASGKALRERQSARRSSESSIREALEKLGGKGLARDPRFAGRVQRKAGENLRLKYGEIQSKLGEEMQALEDLVRQAQQARQIEYGLVESQEAEYRADLARLFPAASQYGVI